MVQAESLCIATYCMLGDGGVCHRAAATVCREGTEFRVSCAARGRPAGLAAGPGVAAPAGAAHDRSAYPLSRRETRPGHGRDGPNALAAQLGRHGLRRHGDPADACQPAKCDRAVRQLPAERQARLNRRTRALRLWLSAGARCPARLVLDSCRAPVSQHSLCLRTRVCDRRLGRRQRHADGRQTGASDVCLRRRSMRA
jgi:hypothetical protein